MGSEDHSYNACLAMYVIVNILLRDIIIQMIKCIPMDQNCKQNLSFPPQIPAHEAGITRQILKKLFRNSKLVMSLHFFWKTTFMGLNFIVL